MIIDYKRGRGLCGKNLLRKFFGYELHHIKSLKYDDSDNPINIVPFCPTPCHKDISSAVSRKDKKLCQYFISKGVLYIPPHLDNFK